MTSYTDLLIISEIMTEKFAMSFFSIYAKNHAKLCKNHAKLNGYIKSYRNNKDIERLNKLE